MKKFFLILVCVSNMLAAKVLIITHVFNRLDFIGIQNATFKKFLQDEYEFVVFCDTPEEESALKVKHYCEKLNLRCVRIPQKIHQQPYLYRASKDYQEPSVRTSNAIQYSLDTLGFNYDGIVVIIDSDLFLVKNFSIEKYMKNWDIAAVLQSRDNGVRHLWNGLVFMDMRTLPEKRTLNFNCGYVEGQPVDTGGYTHYYLKKYPELRLQESNVTHVTGKSSKALLQAMNKRNFRPGLLEFLSITEIPNMEFVIEDAFLHYRGGANWENRPSDFHEYKSKILRQLIGTCMMVPE